jgi:hypothetical protein
MAGKKSTPDSPSLSSSKAKRRRREALRQQSYSRWRDAQLSGPVTITRFEPAQSAESFLTKARANKWCSQSSEDFYKSRAWLSVRYAALIRADGRCDCCGASRNNGVTLHVDHIKPRSKFPALELDLENLQVLCEPCNVAKSNLDMTNWRQKNKDAREDDAAHLERMETEADGYSMIREMARLG